jgi:hypothetical protein
MYMYTQREKETNNAINYWMTNEANILSFIYYLKSYNHSIPLTTDQVGSLPSSEYHYCVFTTHNCHLLHPSPDVYHI